MVESILKIFVWVDCHDIGGGIEVLILTLIKLVNIEYGDGNIIYKEILHVSYNLNTIQLKHYKIN